MRHYSIIFLAFLLLPTGGFGQDTASTFHNDNQRTGRTEYIGPTTPSQLWTFHTQGSLNASPVIAPDGTIYVASTDNHLYALTTKGEIKWDFETNESIYTTPAVGADGVIFVADLAGRCYAINPDGTQKWMYRLTDGTDRRILGSPAVDADGQSYFGSWNNRFYAIHADGALRWEARLSGLITSSPALDHEGNVYIATQESGRSQYLAVHKFRPSSASAVWKFSDNQAIGQHRIISTPAIDAERSRLYVGATGASEGFVCAVNMANGQRVFRSTLPKGVISSPAIGHDGTVFIGCLDGNLYALSPEDGSRSWAFRTEGYFVMGSPAVDGNGNVYVGDSDGILYAISPAGEELWRFEARSNIASAPVIAPDGALYLTSFDSTLYAIGNPTFIRNWVKY
ncbi:MAG: hypothetical protein C4527_15975 [Candidatus Omnitrophota bacterium]|jgi:outer membrane protein assembly factor BamB|nr:MAG: hypothetical protein C4527_15975 [Candidatus Omnitrophota bacterium]